MTIRLLTPYAQRPFNAITTFDASVEAGLIAAGKASADLTGGVRYFAPRPGLVLQSKQVAVGTVSLNFEEQTTVTLPEGQVLLITGAASTVGAASRVGTSDSWVIGAGALPAIGPYAGAQNILIQCTTGSIVVSTQDASLSQVGGGGPTTLTGAVTGSGTGTFATTLDPASLDAAALALGFQHGGGSGESYSVLGFGSVQTPTTASSGLGGICAAAVCNCLIVRNSRENVNIEFQINATGTWWPIQPGEEFPIFGITDASQVGFRRTDYLTSRDTQRTTVTYMTANTTLTYPVTRYRTLTPGNTGFTPLGNLACVGVEMFNAGAIDIFVKNGTVVMVLERFKSLRLDVANINQVSISTELGSPVGILMTAIYTTRVPGAGAPRRVYGIAEVISPTARTPLGDMVSNSLTQFSHPVDSTPFKRFDYSKRRSISFWNLASTVNISAGLTKADVNLNTLPAGSIFPNNGPRDDFTQGTVPVLTFTAGTAESFTSTLNNMAGVDLTGCSIHASLQKVSGTHTLFAVDLFSTGDPLAPGADYHSIGLNSDLSTGGMVATTSVFGRAFGPGVLNVVGAGADLTSIKFARVRVTASAGAQIIPVGIDVIKPNSTKNAVILSIDDNHGLSALYALETLAPLGFPCVLYMSPTIKSVGGNAGVNGTLSIDNLLALQDRYGWQLGSQDYFGTDTVDRTPEQWVADQRKELILGQQLGFDLDGMRDGSLYGATNYPLNAEQLKAVSRLWRSVRRFDNGAGTPSDAQIALPFADTVLPGDPMNMRAMNMDSWISGTQAEQYVKLKSYYTKAKAQTCGGISHYATHTGWANTNLRAAMKQLLTDDILPDVQAGITEVVTMRQLANR